MLVSGRGVVDVNRQSDWASVKCSVSFVAASRGPIFVDLKSTLSSRPYICRFEIDTFVAALYNSKPTGIGECQIEGHPHAPTTTTTTDHRPTVPPPPPLPPTTGPRSHHHHHHRPPAHAPTTTTTSLSPLPHRLPLPSLLTGQPHDHHHHPQLICHTQSSTVDHILQ